MNKIKFIGESGFGFTKGKIYNLIKMEQDDFYFNTWISDNENKIKYIPYINLSVFNENWEVI